mmetsp:Transcript_13032/g.25771  ORF Transcript_13032/g.25771 Transcript_13032/m.25771 type:complete len:209 (+) Transcript_13032:646-1272(+)
MFNAFLQSHTRGVISDPTLAIKPLLSPAPAEKSSALMLPVLPSIVVRRHFMFGRCFLRLNASLWNSSVSLWSSARLEEQSPKANSRITPSPHLNFDISASPPSSNLQPLIDLSLAPDMIALPSGAQRQQLTICMCPCKIARHSPFETLQMRTALSLLEVHTRELSGEKSHPDTTCSCPVPMPPPVRFLGQLPIVATALFVARSQTLPV